MRGILRRRWADRARVTPEGTPIISETVGSSTVVVTVVISITVAMLVAIVLAVLGAPPWGVGA